MWMSWMGALCPTSPLALLLLMHCVLSLTFLLMFIWSVPLSFSHVATSQGMLSFAAVLSFVSCNLKGHLLCFAFVSCNLKALSFLYFDSPGMTTGNTLVTDVVVGPQMIVEPEQRVPDFIKAGADIVSVHCENAATIHLHRTVNQASTSITCGDLWVYRYVA
jgi:hypothetical protein